MSINYIKFIRFYHSLTSLITASGVFSSLNNKTVSVRVDICLREGGNGLVVITAILII